MNYKVYILFSEKLNRFYTGSTSNFDLRMAFHSIAKNRKFTHKATDWVEFLCIDCQSKSQALAIELHIKAMKSKKFILNLKNYPELIESLLSKYI